ncbi:MAG: ThiF family adenylyltransferase [Variovorax sp.]
MTAVLASNHVDAVQTADLERRFGGLSRLYGAEGARRIRSAHVIVVGIGGVGSWTAESLARSGVGALTLVDLDHVAESNINRQIHALSETLGKSKVGAMRERIALINPACRVLALDAFVEADNWSTLLQAASEKSGLPDGVVDACDQVLAKYVLASWALETGCRFISVGAAGGRRRAEKVEIEDLARVTHDPLLARLRHRLRREHPLASAKPGRPFGLACVFSREPVMPPDTQTTENDVNATVQGMAGHLDDVATNATISDDETARRDSSLNCHGYGSVVAVTATFGHCAAGWMLDQLASRRSAVSRTLQS